MAIRAESVAPSRQGACGSEPERRLYLLASRAGRPGRIALSSLLLGIITALPSASRADNPIVQTSYTADPAPMVYDGRLYLYTSHDEDVTVKDFFTMNDWRLYSTVDMVNWTDHGSPAGYKTFSWGTGDAWAVQTVARNGKFYLYAPINNSTGAKIGVLVANSPMGPFTDPVGKALVSTGTGDIDPTVFIDDDGQAYLYWGNPNLWYVKLNTDMTSYPGSPTKVSLTTAGFGTRSNSDRATAYEEGPWFYKRESQYYLIYPADGTPEKISYSTSTAPLGPWTYRGDIMAKETGSGSSFTNHPGIVDYKGHSYFFYHNAALPGGGGYKRSVCVEEFTYGTDGSIPTIKMTSGPSAIATLNPFQQVEAETIAFSSGLKTEVCTDTGGGMNVTSISNGDYIKVKDVDFVDGVTSFDARVSSSGTTANIELHLDSQTGTLLGTCDVSGASAWTTKTCAVSGGSGKHDLFLKFTGGSGDLFKFNWWKFSGPTMPSGDAGTGGASDGGGGAGPGAAGAAGAAGASTAKGAGGAAVGDAGKASGSGGSVAGGSGGSATANRGGSAMGGGGGKVAVAGGLGTGGQSKVSLGTAGNASGGPSGSGGRTGGASGVAQAAGSEPTEATTGPNSGSSGCSCRLGRERANAGLLAALWLVGTGLIRRRPRRPD